MREIFSQEKEFQSYDLFFVNSGFFPDTEPTSIAKSLVFFDVQGFLLENMMGVHICIFGVFEISQNITGHDL